MALASDPISSPTYLRPEKPADSEVARAAVPARSAAWFGALERWQAQSPTAWPAARSAADTLGQLISSGLLRLPDTPRGRVLARMDAAAWGCAPLAPDGSVGALLERADTIEIDVTPSGASAERPEAVAGLALALWRRVGRRPGLRLSLGGLARASWSLSDARELAALAPEITLLCGAAAARAIAASCEPTADAPDRRRRLAPLYEWIAALTGAMAPGAALRLVFGGASLPTPDAAARAIWPGCHCEYSLPLSVDLSPAVAPGAGLEWGALRAALQETALLGPALIEAWRMCDPAFGRGMRPPVRLALTGLDALFAALPARIDEPRARQWAADVGQFARAQVAWAAGEPPAGGIEWDYRPGEAALAPDADAASGSALQTQIALQGGASHAPLIGLRVSRTTGVDSLRLALERCALLGAGEVWLQMSPTPHRRSPGEQPPAVCASGPAATSARAALAAVERSTSAGRRGVVPAERGPAPQAIDELDRPGDTFPPHWPRGPAKPGPGHHDLSRISVEVETVRPDRRAIIVCDRCGQPMALRMRGLWCAACGFHLSGV